MKLGAEQWDRLERHCLAEIDACRRADDEKRPDRERAWRLFLGDKLGDEKPGRSQVVSPDVRDAVLSVLPDLLEIFFGAGDVVTVKPRRTAGAQAAKNMRALLRYRLERQLPMFTLAHDWFMDALIFRNGILQYFWEFGFSWEEREYSLLTAADLERILWDGGEVLEQGQPVYQGYQLAGWRDAKVRERVIHKDQPGLRVVPRGNFLLSPDAVGIDDAAFVAVRDYPGRARYEADARAYGYRKSEPATAENDAEAAGAAAERGRSDPQGLAESAPGRGPVERWVCFLEWEADGEPRKIMATLAGGKLVHLAENVYKRPPFIGITPVRVPHAFEGLSLADLCRQYQHIKTALWRLMLDYLNENVFPQTVVERDSGVNLNDILYGRKVVQADAGKKGAVSYLDKPALGMDVYRVVELVEGAKEQSSGVTRLNQGLTADSLNKTARGIMELIQQANKRLRMIARLFAEMGLKPLYRALIWMEQTFADREVVVALGEAEELALTPADLGGDFDLIVKVGSGNADHQLTIAQMKDLMGQLAALAKLPGGQAMVGPRHVYNMFKQIIEAMGFDPRLFIEEPSTEPEHGPRPSPAAEGRIRADIPGPGGIGPGPGGGGPARALPGAAAGGDPGQLPPAGLAQ